MEVNSIILRTTDLDRAASFWTERVGLSVNSQAPGFVLLDGGPVTVVLSAIDDLPDDESLTEVVFRANDVGETYRSLSGREVPFESELEVIWSTDEGAMVGASFRDPDGHYGTLTGWVENS